MFGRRTSFLVVIGGFGEQRFGGGAFFINVGIINVGRVRVIINPFGCVLAGSSCVGFEPSFLLLNNGWRDGGKDIRRLDEG